MHHIGTGLCIWLGGLADSLAPLCCPLLRKMKFIELCENLLNFRFVPFLFAFPKHNTGSYGKRKHNNTNNELKQMAVGAVVGVHVNRVKTTAQDGRLCFGLCQFRYPVQKVCEHLCPPLLSQPHEDRRHSYSIQAFRQHSWAEVLVAAGLAGLHVSAWCTNPEVFDVLVTLLLCDLQVGHTKACCPNDMGAPALLKLAKGLEVFLASAQDVWELVDIFNELRIELRVGRQPARTKANLPSNACS